MQFVFSIVLVNPPRVDFQCREICTCVKFTFANKIEAMHKWSLVSVKPRSTSRLCSARFIFYSRDQNLRALGCVQTDATLLSNNSQHCWMLHVASVCTSCCMLLDVVGCCCAKFETGQTFTLVQTDATLLAYNSQHCWELLRPFARSLNVRSQKRISGNQP